MYFLLENREKPDLCTFYVINILVKHTLLIILN